MCAEQELVVGNSWFKKNNVYWRCVRLLDPHVVENAGRKGGRQGTNGLCVVTKTNAWETVRCESVERRRRGGLSDHFFLEVWLKLFGGWRSAGKMEGVRNVLNVSELNHSVKEMTYQESLRVKYEMCRGGDVGRSRVWRRSVKSSEIW